MSPPHRVGNGCWAYQALQEAGETLGTSGCCLLCCAWAGPASRQGVGVGPLRSDPGRSLRVSWVKPLTSPLPQGLSGTAGTEVHAHLHPPLLPCHVVTSIWVCVGWVPGGLWKAQRSQTLSDYQAREGWGHLRGSPGASLSSPAPPSLLLMGPGSTHCDNGQEAQFTSDPRRSKTMDRIGGELQICTLELEREL